MEKVKTFRGSCNCYIYDNILIDAGNGINIDKQVQCLIITHEHCDHFAGIDEVECDSIAASGFCAEVVNGKKDEFGLCSYLSLDYPKRKVDRILKDGENVEGEGCTLKVIETPGHAKGAICLYDEDAKILFSGDTVFPDYGMPRTDLLSSEQELLRGSYSKLETLDIETIYPGHGKMIKEKEYLKKIIGLL